MQLDFGETVPEIDVDFGVRLAVSGTIYGASIRAIAEPKTTLRLKLRPFQQRRLNGVVGKDEEGREILFLPKKTTSSIPYRNVYLCPNATSVENFLLRSKNNIPEILAPLPQDPKKASEHIASLRDEIVKSWSGGVSFAEEKAENGEVIVPGFRSPQIGALHALRNQPA